MNIKELNNAELVELVGFLHTQRGESEALIAKQRVELEWLRTGREAVPEVAAVADSDADTGPVHEFDPNDRGSMRHAMVMASRDGGTVRRRKGSL
jgi:hypothetical protein